jgi:SM-20-related protein
MILYVNGDCKIGDGGEVQIHHTDYLQQINPTNGKSVFFKLAN